MFFDMDDAGPVGEVLVWPDVTFGGVPLDQPIQMDAFIQGNAGDAVIVLEGNVNYPN